MVTSYSFQYEHLCLKFLITSLLNKLEVYFGLYFVQEYEHEHEHEHKREHEHIHRPEHVPFYVQSVCI